MAIPKDLSRINNIITVVNMTVARRQKIQDGAESLQVQLRGQDIVHLRPFVGVTGTTISHVETDYLQHLVLQALFAAQEGLAQSGHYPINFIGKGGTILQKADLTDRFSWDLDFSLDKPNIRSVEAVFRTIQSMLNGHGFESSFIVTSYDKSAAAKKDTVVVRLRVKGPSYLKTPKPQAEKAVGIDLAHGEPIYLTPIKPLIIPRYSDIGPYKITMMHPDEIIAEKARAIMTRNSIANTVKDTYDIWLLLNKGYVVDHQLIALKMSKFGEAVFDANRLASRIEQQREVWQGVFETGSKREKATFFRILEIPNFEAVKEDVLTFVRTRRA